MEKKETKNGKEGISVDGKDKRKKEKHDEITEQEFQMKI